MSQSAKPAGDSSLSNVVSKLVRASMGASVNEAVPDDELDRHVAALILKEAKQKEQLYLGKDGIRAYLPHTGLPENNVPRTNKRFLSSIIKSTDEHNKAVLRTQAVAAADAKQQRDAQEREERMARATEAAEERLRRLMGGTIRRSRHDDSGSNSSRSKRRERSWEKRDEADSSRSKKRPRSRERPAERPSSSRRRRSRSRSRSREREPHRSSRHRPRSDSPSGPRSRSPAPRRKRDRSRSRSRSPARKDERKRSHRKEDDRNGTFEEPSAGTSSSRAPAEIEPPPSSRTNHILQSRSNSPQPPSAPPPAVPPPPSEPPSSIRKPKVESSRSRHPHSPSPPASSFSSKMDKYFDKEYDPRLDFTGSTPTEGFVPTGSFDSWDAVLELMKAKREWKAEKKRLEKLEGKKSKGKKSSSSSKYDVPLPAETGPSLMDVVYPKSGQVREWDAEK